MTLKLGQVTTVVISSADILQTRSKLLLNWTVRMHSPLSSTTNTICHLSVFLPKGAILEKFTPTNCFRTKLSIRAKR